MKLNLSRQNITLVYAELDLQDIDSNGLKKLANIQASRVVVAPDQIVATYPPAILIQMDNRRIQLTLQQNDQQMGAVPLWQMASQCHELRSSPKAKLTAYGFNYGMEATLTDNNVYATITSMLEPNSERVKEIMGGDLVRMSFTPVVLFRKDKTICELTLAPTGEKVMRINLNVHFEHEGINLPSADQFKASYEQNEYKDFLALLSRLAGEQK